jgi:hypothetical protein
MSLCKLLRTPAGIRPFPALSPRIFPQMLAPIPRWSSWCSHPFLPRRHRPSSSGDRLGNSTTSPYSDFRTGRVSRGCSDFVMFRPPGLLATQIAPTTMCPYCSTLGSRGFYVPAYLGLLPPRAGDMLAARIGQLTAWGLSPHKIHGLAGRSPLLPGLPTSRPSVL